MSHGRTPSGIGVISLQRPPASRTMIISADLFTFCASAYFISPVHEVTDSHCSMLLSENIWRFGSLALDRYFQDPERHWPAHHFPGAAHSGEDFLPCVRVRRPHLLFLSARLPRAVHSARRGGEHAGHSRLGARSGLFRYMLIVLGLWVKMGLSPLSSPRGCLDEQPRGLSRPPARCFGAQQTVDHHLSFGTSALHCLSMPGDRTLRAGRVRHRTPKVEGRSLGVARLFCGRGSHRCSR